MQSATAPPQPAAPLLWERLRALFARVISVVGAPALIAALSLAPRIRINIVRQLALVEMLARKLLLAEAAALSAAHIDNSPRLTELALAASGLYAPRESRHAGTSSARAVDLAKPESWSARFALAIPRDPRQVQDRFAPRIRTLWGKTPPPPPALERASGRHQSDAFLVARRAEALRRMLHDPAPYAMRLTRTRGIGVARSRDAIRRYTFQMPRKFIADRYDPRLSIDIYAAAIGAHDILTDTG